MVKNRSKKGGCDIRCKKCKNEKRDKNNAKEYARQYRIRFPEKTKKDKEIWRKNNVIKNREGKIRWRKKNPKYIIEYHKKRKEKDPIFRMSCAMRSRIGRLIKRRLGKKYFNFQKYLGCNSEDNHIFNLFKEGMTWDNYGKEWHLDHKRPVASFDLTKKEDQIEAFNYKNLQPMWKKENYEKGSYYEGIYHRKSYI